jgi:hypothetical protein
MKKDELIANVVVLGFFSLMLFFAVRMEGVKRVGDVGGEFWPILILSGGVILSFALLIGNIREYYRGRSSTEEAGVRPETDEQQKRGQKKYWLAVFCLGGYILAMPWIGFVLSTLVFVLVFILSLEERRVLVLSISPFLVTTLMVLIFGIFLGMPLPRGIEFFAGFSRLIY